MPFNKAAMQKFILLVQLIFCSFPLIIWGQEVDKPIKRIGITCTGVGQNEVFTDPDLVGAPGYRGKGFWGAGMVFSQGINRWLEWETGMEFSRHRIEVVPNLPPNMDARTRIENSALITFPLSLKAGFLKYFFVSGGILLDLDAAPDSHPDRLRRRSGSRGPIPFPLRPIPLCQSLCQRALPPPPHGQQKP